MCLSNRGYDQEKGYSSLREKEAKTHQRKVEPMKTVVIIKNFILKEEQS